LAHIARRDYLVNLLQAAVEGVLFYHPAVWWVSHVIRRERELCCDDRVVAATGDAVAYAQALAALEQHRLQLALATTGGPLMFRIHRLLGRRGSRFTTAAPAVGFLIVASAAALLAFPPAGKPRPAQVVLMPQAAAPAPQPAPVPQRQAAGAATPQAEPAPSAESPYRRWMNEEVIWIISNAERTAFNGLQTDQERRQFIEQFWLRRDPTPGTTENELKEEHYRRIAWANDRYTAEIPGWKTDRGMVYVKFGAPDEKEEHPVAGAVPYPYEKWRYRFLEGVGKDIVIEFVDPTQTNKYRMGQTLYERMGIAEPSGNMFDRMEQMIRLQNRQQPPTQ
jgi:GWxTD domain-containing protein